MTVLMKKVPHRLSYIRLSAHCMLGLLSQSLKVPGLMQPLLLDHLVHHGCSGLDSQWLRFQKETADAYELLWSGIHRVPTSRGFV